MSPRLTREQINKLKEFAAIVKKQVEGDPSTANFISKLKPELADGYCLYNLYEQWQGAFSYIPGRLEALTPICDLAAKISAYQEDNTLRMFNEPEWGRLVKLRGPFDCVIFCTCKNCSQVYPSFGQSGFDDRSATVCNLCGNVWLQFFYDTATRPTCSCGGHFVQGCPKCHSSQAVEKRSISPYEYFSNHSWFEKREG